MSVVMNDGYSPIRRGARFLLRVSATASALLACLQPVLAGAFLQGNFSMLSAHRTAGLIFLVALLPTLAAALLAWNRGLGWRATACTTLALVLCGVQLAFGFTRDLLIHVPLGSALVYLAVRIAVLAWKMPLARPSVVENRVRAGVAA
jgi:hypothetical protein